MTDLTPEELSCAEDTLGRLQKTLDKRNSESVLTAVHPNFPEGVKNWHFTIRPSIETARKALKDEIARLTRKTI